MNLVTSNAVQTMSTREIADFLKKDHSNLKISAERLAKSGVISTLAPQEFTHNGNVYIQYMLNKRDSLVLVAQNCPEFTAAIVDRWQELESQAAPVVPQTYIGALKALVAAEEAKESAIQLATHAIATKAEIGNRREATAMNTASQAVKQVAKLEIELDKSKEWATIKRMEILHPTMKFNWRKLKSVSNALELDIQTVPDANYFEVKSYHAKAWLEAYGIEL